MAAAGRVPAVRAALVLPLSLVVPQTTMRSELGKITLDKTFEEREALNANIVASINSAADAWGLTCLRCGRGEKRGERGSPASGVGRCARA